MENFNRHIFNKINSLQGKNRWLDAFGRAGAEWIIIAMIGWYISACLVDFLPDWKKAIMPMIFFSATWVVAWGINVVIGLIIRESRPQVSEPSVKQLFSPMMSWKSFPSDHIMSAFLLFFMALVFNLSGSWALLILALWVAWGRIYSGVHYPVDALGGFSVATFAAVCAAIIRIIFT